MNRRSFSKKKKSNLISRLNKPKSVNQKQNKAIMNLQKRVTKLQRSSEVKFKTATHVFAGLDSGNSNFLLNGITKGSNSDQRIGDSVKLLTLVFRSAFVHQFTDRTFIRIIIYMNRQNNNSSMIDVDEILLNTTGNLNKIISVFNPRFVGKGKKYQILSDDSFETHAGAISGNLGSTNSNPGQNDHTVHLNKVIKLGHIVKFSTGDTGSATDIINHALRILIISNDDQSDYGHSFKLMYLDT